MSIATLTPTKRRRDPRTGKVYVLDGNQWSVDDAATDDAAGRSFDAAMTQNVNAQLGGEDDEEESERGGPGSGPHTGGGTFDERVSAAKKKSADARAAAIKAHGTPGFEKAKQALSDAKFEETKLLNEQDRHSSRSEPASLSDVIRKAEVSASSWNDASNSIEAVICTDTPCYSTEVKTGKSVKEVWLMSGLEFDPHVRCLNDHNREGVEHVLGTVSDHRPGEHDCTSRIYLSSAEPAICTKVKEGHIRDVSVGGERREIVTIPPGQSKEISGQIFTADQTEPLNVVTRLRVYEVSLTPIGSDPAAVTRSETRPDRSSNMAISKSMRKFLERAMRLSPSATDEEASRFHDAMHPEVQKACRAFADVEDEEEKEEEEEEEEEKTEGERAEQAIEEDADRAEEEKKEDADRADEEKKEDADRSKRAAAAKKADVTRKAAIKEGAKAEQDRQAEIKRMGEGLVSEEVIRKAIDGNWTVNRAARDFLKIQRERTASAMPFIQSRSVEKDMTREVIGAALVIRSMSQLPSDAAGKSYASNPVNLINRYQPEEFNHNGLGDWSVGLGRDVTAPLSDVQRKRNEELLNRADPHVRNLNMVEVCRHALRLDGIDVPGSAAPAQIVTAALQSAAVTRADSGGSFAAIMTQNYNAQMLGAYLETSDSTLGWCSEGDAPDFKPGELAQVGKMGNLTLNGKAPAQDLTYGDWNEIIQVSRFSSKFEVDEQDLINDRFGVLRSNSPQEMGLSARRLRPNLVYSILMKNYSVGTGRGPTLNQDGAQLFCSAHGNFLTAANNDLYTVATGAVGIAGLQRAIPAIKKQRLNGVPLNLVPRFALLPPDLDMGIRSALFSTQRIVASGSGGTMNPLQAFNIEARSDARLDETGSVDPLNLNTAVTGLHYHYILVCRPGEEGAKTVHVNYLLGSGRAPQIRSYILGGPGAPGRWGIGWDVKLDIGAAVEDYRGLYYAESST